MLSEHYFGDVDAFEEKRNHPSFFESTFVRPSSFSSASLANNKKYIVVGRKGTGKTAIQVRVARELEEKGYVTWFFSFFDGVKQRDFNDAVRTQRLDLVDIANPRHLFSNYDFREVWERTILTKFAEAFTEAGLGSNFTRFMLGEKSGLTSVFEGVLKTLSVKLSADVLGIGAEVNADFSKYSGEAGVPLLEYVDAARKLFFKHHRDHQAAIFIDELVFSRLDSKDDEIRVRAAMVRDILRVAKELNGAFVVEGSPSVVFCTLRPEVRDLLCDLDAEISKSIDGKFVDLVWDTGDGAESLLIHLFKQKIIHSRQGRQINVGGFLADSIRFGTREVLIPNFIMTNTWARPRDIVHFLDSVQTKNPNAGRMGEGEIKSSLNEFSRRLIGDVKDEISVKHGAKIMLALRHNLKQKEFRDYNEMYQKVFSKVEGIDKWALAEDLYFFGVIGNIENNPRRYYWFHRGEEFLKPDRPVYIHPGLWNYFNIR